MEHFGYIRAESVSHALALLNETGVRSQVLAGGTDLLLLLRVEPRFCDRVVDVSLVPELHRITRLGDTVTIGAATSFSEVMDSPLVQESAPVLAEACRQVGAVQVRNMGTLGGNVANAAACADSLPALICLDARARLLTVAAGSAPDAPAQAAIEERDWPVDELVTGPNRTRILPGELLVSLGYRVPEPGSRSVFLKLGRRNAMAISRLTVAALGRLDREGRIAEARLVPGSATPQIRRFREVEELLVGRVPEEPLFQEAGRAAADEMRRLAGRRWSSEFKEPALEAMVARALRAVFDPRTGQGLGDSKESRETRYADSSLAPRRPLSWPAEPFAPSPRPARPAGRGGQTGPGAGRLPLAPDEASRTHTDHRSPTASPGVVIRLTVNGRIVQVEAPADASLLAVLRDHLGLTGTKEGCGVGECGACSVLLDGRLVNSCLTLAAQAHGRQVTTIEGIRGPDGGPNDLQQAFIEYGAVQCGFCIPGMVLAGEALLATNVQPTRTEIRQAIAGNLCRCTGYQQIVDAIEATAAKRKA
jgi:xanthine dehydrogenase iron-sulfur cluster and FAD-binding subunit A